METGMSKWETLWDEAHESAKYVIKRFLSSEDESEKEFVKLANWCFSTDISPRSFLPSGMQKSFDTSLETLSFIFELHEAMVVSGELMFGLRGFHEVKESRMDEATGEPRREAVSAIRGSPCFEIVGVSKMSQERHEKFEKMEWTVDEFISAAEDAEIERKNHMARFAAKLRVSVSNIKAKNI